MRSNKAALFNVAFISFMESRAKEVYMAHPVAMQYVKMVTYHALALYLDTCCNRRVILSFVFD